MNALDLACALARKFEGIEDGDKLRPGLQPYRDPEGYWTIGYGHLITKDRTIAMPDMTWSMEDAEADLQRGMGERIVAVDGLLKVPATPGQLAAMADFTYNLGIGSFRASTLLRKFNRGDTAGAYAEFPKWKFSGGRVLRGLELRRAAEQVVFNS